MSGPDEIGQGADAGGAAIAPQGVSSSPNSPGASAPGTFWGSLTKFEDATVWRLRGRGLSFAEIERDILHIRQRLREGGHAYWAKHWRAQLRRERA